jgi:hypothetical protein
MADEQRDNREQRDRAGFGDGQGTTVGAPQPGQREVAQTGEGSAAGDRASRVAESGEGQEQSRGRSTGAGAEAGGTRPQAAPVDGHETEHRSGYGGAGGQPVTSSDTREPHRPSERSKPSEQDV